MVFCKETCLPCWDFARSLLLGGIVFAALSVRNRSVPVGRPMLRGCLAFNSRRPWRSRAWANSSSHSGPEQIQHLRVDPFLHSAFPAMSPRWSLGSGPACPEPALGQEATRRSWEGKDVCWRAQQSQPSFGQPQGAAGKKSHLGRTEEYKGRDGIVCRLERGTCRKTKKERGRRKAVSDWEPNPDVFTIRLHSALASSSRSCCKRFGEWQVRKNFMIFI